MHLLGQKEQGIVTTFGQFSRTLGPGVALTLPWPIQSVAKRDVTTIILTRLPAGEEENLILTSDKNLVNVSYQIRWKVRDLEAFTFELSDPEETVAEVAEAAMRSSVAEMPLNAVWGGSGRGELQDNVRRRMQAVLDAYRSGVQILGVEIKKADPPNKVAGAFQEVNNAQQDAQKYISQAQGWAQQKIALAEGEASAFNSVYEQYRLAPDVTRRRLYYETMERVLANNEKVIVGSSGAVPYLPLPEVRRRPAPAPAAPGGQ
jgi:membrane protease subunit HflK